MNAIGLLEEEPIGASSWVCSMCDYCYVLNMKQFDVLARLTKSDNPRKAISDRSERAATAFEWCSS